MFWLELHVACGPGAAGSPAERSGLWRRPQGGCHAAGTPEGKPTFKLQNKEEEKEKEEVSSVAGRPLGHGNTTAKSSSGT